MTYGLTVKQVNQITATSDLVVKLLGRGVAVAQDPPPGTVIAIRHARVRIRFEAPEGEI